MQVAGEIANSPHALGLSGPARCVAFRKLVRSFGQSADVMGFAF